MFYQHIIRIMGIGSRLPFQHVPVNKQVVRMPISWYTFIIMG